MILMASLFPLSSSGNSEAVGQNTPPTLRNGMLAKWWKYADGELATSDIAEECVVQYDDSLAVFSSAVSVGLRH